VAVVGSCYAADRGPFPCLYERLRRALRAEIDESRWASLCSTKRNPFPPPSTGRIAVKVINHYKDEVLVVFNVPEGRSTPSLPRAREDHRHDPRSDRLGETRPGVDDRR
jgi:hypothetical protein